MSEIKSTMDIIMEKTKGMTLTKKEKKDIQRKEVEGKIQGLLQKLADGAMDMGLLKTEMGGFEGQKSPIAREALQREVLSRMDPLGENAQLLEILGDVLGLDPAPYVQVVTSCRDSLASEASRRASLLGERFKEQGVSGGAVIPNLHADPEWRSFLTQKTEEMREQLASIQT